MNTNDMKTIDLGISQEHPTKMQTLEVSVNLDSMARDYAAAFVDEAYRINYDKANYVQLGVDELFTYLKYLLSKRIQCVYGRCSDFRQLKQLWIPSYFQYVLSTVGIAYDREVGLKFVPVLEGIQEEGINQIPEHPTFSEVLAISEKIAAFKDELKMVQDAMPRDIHGDLNIMATAMLNDYVSSCRRVEHPAATYVTVFLDMKLREEMTFAMLYRRRYGETELIRQVLPKDRRYY